MGSRGWLQEKMMKLSQQARTVLILFDVMEFSHQEIAEILDIEAGAVKVRLHRARKKFKEILEQECSFEKDERSVLVCEPKESQCENEKG